MGSSGGARVGEGSIPGPWESGYEIRYEARLDKPYAVYDEYGKLLDNFKTGREADSFANTYKQLPIHTLPFTPEMKESVLYKGQAMFSGGPDTSEYLRKVYEQMKRKEESPSDRALVTTVLNQGQRQDVAADVSPQGLTFKQVAEDLAPGGPRRFTGPVFPPPPLAGARALKMEPGKLKRDLYWIEQHLLSNNITAANAFEQFNNPVNDLMDGQIKLLDRMTRYLPVLNRMVDKYRLKQDVVKSETEGKQLLDPLLKKWLTLNDRKIRMTHELTALEGEYEAEGLDKRSERGQDLRQRIKELKSSLAAEPEDIKNQREVVMGQRKSALTYLKKKYSNVRLFMALDGDAEAQKLLTPDEQKMYDETRKYLNDKKVELQKLGKKVIDENYVRYVYREALAGEDPGVRQYAEKLWGGSSKLNSSQLDFISRTPGSQSWYPFWYQSMKQYIPAVERKIAFSPFRDKWMPAMKAQRNEFPRAYDWFAHIWNENFSGKEMEPLERAVNFLTNVEYGRTLVMNLSVPTLHLFKLLQTPAWHGPEAFSKGLYRFGKAMMQKAAGLEGPERQVLELYVRMRPLVKTIEQSPGMSNAMKGSFWRNLGMAPTMLIEYFDNGVNLMSAIERGVKAGAAPAFIHQASMDTMMRLNFRGFNLPRFLSGPIGRVGGMYQMTPFKLLENKIDLLPKILRGEADAYGDKYINKAIRLFTILGLVYMGGKHYLNRDLKKHVVHPPFMAPAQETGEYTWPVVASPVVQLPVDIAKKGFVEGMITHFAPMPAFDRLAMYLNDEVSPKYGSQLWQQLGVPEAGAHEDIVARKEWQKYMEQKRHPFREYYKQSPGRRFLKEKFSILD